MLAVLGTSGAAAQDPLDALDASRGDEERVTALDLRREAARAPLSIPLPPLDAEQLSAARDNWRERMVSEHASARVFGAMLAPMMRAGLPAAELRRVADMARQELDHAVLCARVLSALGAPAVHEMPRLDDVPFHEDASPLEAVVRNAISIGCCSETVAVALVATEREQAGPPAVRRVLDQILRDEVKHSRFGWRLVRCFAPKLSTRERDGVDAYLVDVFSHQLRFHAPFLDMPSSDAKAASIGAPHGASNWAIFVDVMLGVVVPGLARAGLGAHAAWAEATRPALGTA